MLILKDFLLFKLFLKNKKMSAYSNYLGTIYKPSTGTASTSYTFLASAFPVGTVYYKF